MFNCNNSLSVVQKICLAGLLTALATVCQKVFAINYIPVVPFLRISFGGPAVIIFASIFLGPIYGMVVGAVSDLFGYLVFDPKTMGFFPQITAIYLVLGFVPYFIYNFLKAKSTNKAMLIAKYSLIVLLYTAVALYICLNNEIKLYGTTHTMTLTIRISCLVGMALLTIISEIFILLIRKQNRLKNIDFNIDSLNIALIIIEVLVMVLFGTLMKGFAFGFETYPAILLCQVVVMFVNIPLNLFLVSLFLTIAKRYRK